MDCGRGRSCASDGPARSMRLDWSPSYRSHSANRGEGDLAEFEPRKPRSRSTSTSENRRARSQDPSLRVSKSVKDYSAPSLISWLNKFVTYASHRHWSRSEAHFPIFLQETVLKWYLRWSRDNGLKCHISSTELEAFDVLPAEYRAELEESYHRQQAEDEWVVTYFFDKALVAFLLEATDDELIEESIQGLLPDLKSLVAVCSYENADDFLAHLKRADVIVKDMKRREAHERERGN